jgi:phage regulator Rha-like protein
MRSTALENLEQTDFFSAAYLLVVNALDVAEIIGKQKANIKRGGADS